MTKIKSWILATACSANALTFLACRAKPEKAKPIVDRMSALSPMTYPAEAPWDKYEMGNVKAVLQS